MEKTSAMCARRLSFILRRYTRNCASASRFALSATLAAAAAGVSVACRAGVSLSCAMSQSTLAQAESGLSADIDAVRC